MALDHICTVSRWQLLPVTSNVTTSTSRTPTQTGILYLRKGNAVFQLPVPAYRPIVMSHSIAFHSALFPLVVTGYLSLEEAFMIR